MIDRSAHSQRALAHLLASETGQEIAQSRAWRIETALRPLMKELGLPGLPELVDQIEAGVDRSVRLRAVDAMLNHETSFFRDLPVFQSLEHNILPALRAEATNKALRIWSVGCSNGMEPYSIAMMIRRMGSLWKGWKISIVATDVSPLSIDNARKGRFAQMEVQRGLPIDDLLRWFEPTGEQWEIASEIRNMVQFQTDDILSPTLPPEPFDLILCRNVMLYFPEATRMKACANLERYAKPGTYLLLGAGETLMGCQSVFSLNADIRCAYRAQSAAMLRQAS